MKNLVLFILMLVSFTAFSQTPFSMMSSHERTTQSASRVTSFDNAWLGAGLLYNVSGEVDGSFILNGRGFYLAAHGANYGIPILTNVSLNQADTLNDENGVRFGVYPYYVFANTGNLKLITHGGLAYNILDKTDVNTKTQFRALLGVEAAFYPATNKQPFTLSIAPEYVMSVQDVNENRWQLSVTGILPITNGLGLLVESQTPFSKNLPGSIQIGVVVAAELKP